MLLRDTDWYRDKFLYWMRTMIQALRLPARDPQMTGGQQDPHPEITAEADRLPSNLASIHRHLRPAEGQVRGDPPARALRTHGRPAADRGGRAHQPATRRTSDERTGCSRRQIPCRPCSAPRRPGSRLAEGTVRTRDADRQLFVSTETLYGIYKALDDETGDAWRIVLRNCRPRLGSAPDGAARHGPAEEARSGLHRSAAGRVHRRPSAPTSPGTAGDDWSSTSSPGPRRRAS
ncbi:MAG: hypothetical protein U5R48_18110 [Gammaproteobacteria bacterium]|nr:hypothetical protein [Gammaproteobacteria bacterium]